MGSIPGSIGICSNPAGYRSAGLPGLGALSSIAEPKRRHSRLFRQFPAVGLRGLMRKVSEYQQHAAECRQLAAKMKDPTHKKQLEEMAEAWSMLAAERARQIARQAGGAVNPVN